MQTQTQSNAPAEVIAELPLGTGKVRALFYKSGTIGFKGAGWDSLKPETAAALAQNIEAFAQAVAALRIQGHFMSKEMREMAFFQDRLAHWIDQGLPEDKAALLANAEKQAAFAKKK